MLNNGDVILSVKDLHVKFSLRGKVLNVEKARDPGHLPGSV